MRSILLPLALSFLLAMIKAAPLPTASDSLQEREPLPPVFCVWDEDNEGKHKHLVCNPKTPYGSSDPENDDDGELGNLVGGAPGGTKTP